MKNLVSFLFLLLVTTSLFGQSKRHEIRLKQPTHSVSTDFFFNEILDKRFITDNVGYVQKGLTNRKVVAGIKGGFERAITDFINEMINPRGGAEELSCIIHEFNVAELTTFTKESGICRITIEIARKVGSEYYSLGNFYAEIEEGKLDATGSHHKRISNALLNCITQFMQSEWKQQEGYLIDLRDDSPNCDLTSVPKAGLYASFNRMCSGHPLDYNFNALIPIEYKQAERYEHISGSEANQETSNVMYISDGTDIYMHASRYSYNSYFVKAQAYGRFLYFEDHLSSAASLAAASPITALVTTGKRGIVLDTTNGKIAVLTNNFLRELTQDHPDIFQTYLGSEQKRADKKQVIMALNQAYHSAD
ncbi:MAG: hypothetical protein AAFN81_09845 [Bacteroidota bacterium]